MIYKEMPHFGHPHVLKPVTNEKPFTCNGCKELGWGPRFRCADCNYNLHKVCALSPPSLTHLSSRDSVFKFHERVINEDAVCRACGKPTLGFVYVSGRKMFHPCCINLPAAIQIKNIQLVLEKRVWSKCYRCEDMNLSGRVKGWSYRSTCKNYHIHLSCVKDMVKEWKEKHSGETNMDVGDVLPNIGRLPDHTDDVLNLYFSYVMGDCDLHSQTHFFKPTKSASNSSISDAPISY